MSGTSSGSEIDARVAVIIVAGVSGSGKSTVGEKLAAVLGWTYAEADTFHPKANIAKMSAGVPLTDEDRAPWLAKIAAFIAQVCDDGGHAVVSCSALKHVYRDTLVGKHRDQVRIVLLDGSEDEFAARLAARKGHFMPPALLHSQFLTLERPSPDERVLVVSVLGTPDIVVAHVLDALRTAA